jgi:hypothetical protein
MRVDGIKKSPRRMQKHMEGVGIKAGLYGALCIWMGLLSLMGPLLDRRAFRALSKSIY